MNDKELQITLNGIAATLGQLHDRMRALENRNAEVQAPAAKTGWEIAERLVQTSNDRYTGSYPPNYENAGIFIGPTGRDARVDATSPEVRDRTVESIRDNFAAAIDEAVRYEREECARLIGNGRFLHDQAPDARFAKAAAAAIRARK